MVALSVNGITALSVRPIRLIVLMGIILFVPSMWVFANTPTQRNSQKGIRARRFDRLW
ncbi:MAG TPA: hypothetical protein VH558_06060 [Pseudolabrys sp.]|jgi:hypothetical protein